MRDQRQKEAVLSVPNTVSFVNRDNDHGNDNLTRYLQLNQPAAASPSYT